MSAPITSLGARSINPTGSVPHRGGPKQATSGAFGYGLCACNSDSGTAQWHHAALRIVQLADLRRRLRSTGMAVRRPSQQEGPSVIALGWNGYSLGFTDFAVAPVIGTYHLYAAVPPAYDTPQNPTPSPNPDQSPTAPPGILVAGAQLTSLKALPQFATPTFTPDRKGGGSIGVTVPAGATEAMADRVRRARRQRATCGQAHQFDSLLHDRHA